MIEIVIWSAGIRVLAPKLIVLLFKKGDTAMGRKMEKRELCRKCGKIKILPGDSCPLCTRQKVEGKNLATEKSPQKRLILG